MPSTYSISVGLPTEALRKQDITSVLLDLPDNTQKLISPKDVRDAFLSTWANAAFKQTIGLSSIEYIGIDSGNPSNRDIKQKIFIGKRQYAGLDIMNSNLLSPDLDTDIYFYNTKPDNVTQSSTKIAILAGTNSSIYLEAPYIESKLNSTGSATDFNIVNPSVTSGTINILSNTGRVSINGIVFPTISETAASASNGRILKYSGTYPNGSLRWEDPTITISSIGVAGTPTYIFGSPSYVNGYELEFVDSSIVPQTIGGIDIGMSFSAFSFDTGSGFQNWPIVEVLRKLLYPYVEPSVSLQLSSTVTGTNYAEIGTTTSVVFTYSVTKYSENIDDFQIIGPNNVHSAYPIGVLPGYSGLSLSGDPGNSTTVTFSYDAYKKYQSPTVVTPVTNDYVLQVSDSGIASYTYSATASLTFVSPFFSSFLNTDISVGVLAGIPSLLRSLQIRGLINTSAKHIKPYPGASQSIMVNYSGSGYLYFLTPFSYPKVSQIKDPNGFIVHDESYVGVSTFTYSASITPGILLSTDIDYGPFRVYKTIATCSYTGVGDFEFIFL